MSESGTTVAVLGGGVGGLSAAQELAERSFDVTVYETRDCFGGKARSIEVPDSAPLGQKPLVGEHGFRFFPGFYHHITDTMKRIPYKENSNGVYDNLIETSATLIASNTGPETVASTETPSTPGEWIEMLQPQIAGPELSSSEVRHFSERLFAFMTSCEDRRNEEYEYQSWWDFINADDRSDAYRKHLAQATQALVALRPRKASARTMGQIYVQLLRGQLDPTMSAEKILNGPTSKVWIGPWTEYLADLGVDLQSGTPVREIHSDGRRVTGVTVGTDTDQQEIQADYYVAAMPVEVMTQLLNDDLRRGAPSLARLDRLETEWMNGIQFYLTDDVPVVEGHQVHSDAPWALTSVSQPQFWEEDDINDRGNEAINGSLSVIVSDWNTEGILYEKPARECTREEIKEEVWAQLKTHLNTDTERRLTDDMLCDWFLDPAIVEHDDENAGVWNQEPLLINTVGSLQYRPEATTEMDNLLLAADYVRTNTDLATMECANEAARRATNAIINRSGARAAQCKLWELEEPGFLKPFRQQDALRYRLGLPHPGDVVNRIRGFRRRDSPAVAD
jgi:uncharacterized protein with NAD-binding domain and iron-sulfur cluster